MNDLLEHLGEIDWKRLAKPQEDQYDTAVFEKIAAHRWGWKHVDPPRGAVTWLDGQVEIVQQRIVAQLVSTLGARLREKEQNS